IEAALLIECGYKEIVDEMWYIYTNIDVRRKRLKESRGYSDAKIDSILKSQLSEEEYRKNSDFEIDNSGLCEDSFEQIRERLGENS
ncbi:MAG: dephospho-CoA kinase, partial [Lachnospiraceae bacterium]|nr:dephospho-CoA kinase [Lachnospiraceae bacterium]